MNTETDDTTPLVLPLRCSPTFAQVATALAAAQGAFPPIPRDKPVTVDIKDKETRRVISSYTYRYAPLETIIEKTRPALSQNGLAVIQTPELVTVEGKVVEVVRTILIHTSGEWMACDIPQFFAKGQNAAQDYGSSLTYARRYGMTLLLCVAADEDDDGQTLQGSERPGQSASRGNSGPPMPSRKQQVPDDLEQALREVDARPPSKAAQPGIGPAAAPEEADPTLVVAPRQDAVMDPATGEIPSPWGSDLLDGQLAMAKQRAKTAGLSDPAVLELFGVITQSNLRDSLAKLKELADKELER